MGDAAPSGGLAAGLARACDAEIRAHQLIFALFMLPLLVLFVPSLLVALGFNLLSYLAAPAVASGLRDHFHALQAAMALLCGLAALAYARGVYTHDERSGTSRAVRAPVGAQGEVLRDRVRELWSTFSQGDPPHVFWFPNFNVLARAWDARGKRHIEVSSGLWERVVRGDRVADFILAHEIAHLTKRDIPSFRRLAAASAAARSMLQTLLWLGAFFAILAACLRFAAALGSRQSPAQGLLEALSTLIVAALLLLAVPLSEISIRRYAGFIASLMEMRADITAALGTSGLHRISSAISADPTVRGSSLRDLGRSLVAVNLTHLPDSERLRILASTDRLITPKLRYFAFSLLLAAVFPVNPVTYLVWGGALDHMLTTSLVGAFFAASVAMIIHGSTGASLSLPRALIVATALSASAILPLFSVNDFAYLLTHLVAGITIPAGLGAEPLTIGQIASDSWTTIAGVAGKIWKAAAEGAITMSILFCTFAVMALAFLARSLAPRLRWQPRLAIFPTAATCILLILTSRDPWRDAFYTAWPLSQANTISASLRHNAWLGLCLPLLGALAAFAAQAPFFWRPRGQSSLEAPRSRQ